MKLTPKQRQYLKGLAHSLAPVVRVGKAGSTAAVLAKTQECLLAHELLKVRIDADLPERREIAAQIAASAGAALVSEIGKIAILYRPRPEEPTIQLPPR